MKVFENLSQIYRRMSANSLFVADITDLRSRVMRSVRFGGADGQSSVDPLVESVGTAEFRCEILSCALEGDPGIDLIGWICQARESGEVL